MDYTTLQLKNELLQWIMTVEDKKILEKIKEIKGNSGFFVREAQAEYAVKDDFEERWAKGISGDEIIENVHEFIDTLPWKKV